MKERNVRIVLFYTMFSRQIDFIVLLGEINGSNAFIIFFKTKKKTQLFLIKMLKLKYFEIKLTIYRTHRRRTVCRQHAPLSHDL